MAFSLLEAVSESCFKRQELNLVIVGIDGAGKTSILERMKSIFAAPRKMPTIPLDKIQSTVGLNIAKLELCNCRVMIWDLGGKEQMRALWDRYYGDSQGWIFAIDSADQGRLDEAIEVFRAAWDRPELQALPCLIVANKQDSLGALTPDDLKRVFDMKTRESEGRLIRLQPASAVTMDGIKDGVLWLVRQAKQLGPTHLRP